MPSAKVPGAVFFYKIGRLFYSFFVLGLHGASLRASALFVFGLLWAFFCLGSICNTTETTRVGLLGESILVGAILYEEGRR